VAKQATVMSPRRGDVYWVDFDPTYGAEINKTRPALVLQNDIANHHSPITIVAAITSKYDDSLYPTEVFVRSVEGGLAKDAVVLLNQLRSIDKRSLVKRLCRLNLTTMQFVDRALQLSVGLVKL
jgi:mRNA interferase MazF